MTLEDEIKAIDKEISKLQQERRDLEAARIEEFQESHLDSIGRCFRTDTGDYVVITDVPRTVAYMAGESFNQYQFPCLIIAGEDNKELIGNDEVPFWYDTEFTHDGKTFGVKYNANESAWEEIPKEEFRIHLFNELDGLYKKLCGILFPEDGGYELKRIDPPEFLIH